MSFDSDLDPEGDYISDPQNADQEFASGLWVQLRAQGCNCEVRIVIESLATPEDPQAVSVTLTHRPGCANPAATLLGPRTGPTALWEEEEE